MPRRATGLILLLFVALLAAYLPAIGSGFIWDDNKYVTENESLTTVEGLKKIWSDPGANIQYYPLVFTSFWVEWHLWGTDPLGYHLDNVLLHGLNALVLWQVLSFLSVPGAWLAAAVFAFHPIQVETVAWVTERKNLLSSLCYLLALWSYLRFALPRDERAADGRRKIFYGLAIVLFYGALSSKTVTASLPVACLVLLWYKRGSLKIRDGLPLLPMFAMAAALGSVTAYLEKFQVGAHGPDWAFTTAERVLIAGRAFWFYIFKILWPQPLIFIYPRWEVSAAESWQYLFPLAVPVAFAAAWLLRKRTGRGPLAALLFYAVTILPALGFFSFYPMLFSFVADHFQYLAGIGVIVLVTSSAAVFASTFFAARKRLRTLSATGLLVILALLTWRQSGIYHSRETLWQDVLAGNPASFLAHNNIGDVYYEKGETAKARRHFEKALGLKADHAPTHYNLGILYSAEGSLAKAAESYRQTLVFAPGDHRARNNLGEVLFRLGRLAEAEDHLRQVVHGRPRFADGLYNLGMVLDAGGNFSEAAQMYRRVAALQPQDAEALFRLAAAESRQGELKAATRDYERLLRLEPEHGEAHLNLCVLLFQEGRTSKARHHCGEALRIDPGNEKAHFNMGFLLQREGRLAEAERHYREAVRLRPDYRKAAEALRQAERARRNAP